MVAEDGGDGWSEGRNSVPKISRPTLSSLLNGNADLSEDMALRIEKAFGVKMDTLMRVQVVLRHCPNAQTRATNPCAAHFLVGRHALA
jgi:plasmid maintenance system antidote protein VapI